MKVIIKNARQAYMTFFEPKVPKSSGAPKPAQYSGTFIVDEQTTITVPEMNIKGAKHSELKKVSEVARKNKNGKVTAKDKIWEYNKADGSTTRDEYVDDHGDFHDGFDAETWFVSAKKLPKDIAKSKCGQFQAGELYVVNQAKTRINAQDGLIKPGDRVNLIIDVFGFSGDEAKGSTASLEAVQLLRSDQALSLGGGARASSGTDDFDEEEIEEDEAADLM